jgi:hypothetical protein
VNSSADEPNANAVIAALAQFSVAEVSMFIESAPRHFQTR